MSLIEKISSFIYSILAGSMILARNESRLARNELRLGRNKTSGGNLPLSGILNTPSYHHNNFNPVQTGGEGGLLSIEALANLTVE